MIPFSHYPYHFEFEPGKDFTAGELEVIKEGAEEPFASRVDLASTRSRSEWANEANELYPETFDNVTELKRGMVSLLAHVKEKEKIEAAKKGEEGENDKVHAAEKGTEAWEKAMEILQDEDVLERFASDMKRLGHVGEWNNKKLAAICLLSARAELPVQPSTHASSSSGKNYLWDRAIALMPPELVFKRTGFSAKALFRTNMSLKHSILYIQELAGSEGADFSIRTLQSDGVLRWEATEKQPDGTMANIEYEVEGPTVIIQTTTRNHLHPENETRVVPLYLDESALQTNRIIEEVKKQASGERGLSQEEEKEICEAWHEAIRLLQPAPVVIPFAERIQIPTVPIRLRRDVPRLFNIIKIIAWIHQHHRDRDEKGRIIATEKDFEAALSIVGDSFARAWKNLTPSEEAVYGACKNLPENLRKHGFKRSHIEQVLEKGGEKIPPRTLKGCLYTLSSNGYLESDGRKGAAGATYTMTGAEETGGSITLSARLPIDENPQELPANERTLMGKSQSARSCPLPIKEQQQLSDEDEEWAKGKRGQNETRPLKSDDLQVKSDKRQTGIGYDKKGKTQLGSYEYLDK